MSPTNQPHDMDTANLATATASSMLSKLGELLVTETGCQIGYFIHYNKNIKNLKMQAEKLKLKQDGIQLTVDTAKRNGDVILPEVEAWLGGVDKLWKEATIFLEHDVKENKGCMYGWCPNMKACYSLSRRSKKMIEGVTELQNQGDGFKKISELGRPMGIELTSMGNFRSFLSRERITQQLKDIVKGGDFHMIGVCGLGGVGKTTLIKEVGKWAREEKLFDEIVMAVVSLFTLSDVQDELVDKLGLKYTEKSLSGRAARLWDRLLQGNQRNLVILDDVWEYIDLKEIGIPVGGYENKKNTIVLTSRNEEVCNAMGCDKIIKVDVLTEEEAWILFRDMAGATTVDAPDYIEVASKIARECGGLPIAVVTVGSALKGKKIEVWNDAHLKLSQSIVPANLPGVEKKVFQSLQLSYDQVNFEDKEAGSIFLLCCLYHEDANIPLEELVRYGMGSKLFKGIKLVMQARDRVHALIEKLQKCFLLLDGEEPYTVKMHDVVRDVGIWIASEKDSFKMVVINGEWERDAEYDHCKALSVISSEISELPLEGLNCPELDVLHMSCNMLSTEKLNSGRMFEGMKKLRVLSMFSMNISLLPASLQLLTNLRVLNLEYCPPLTDVCCIPEQLATLEILCLRGCESIEKVPREMGRLTNLRVLDMRGCPVKSVSPGVISSMCRLEELYTKTWLWDEEGNASLNELESLSNLTILKTGIQCAKFLPKHPIFEKLKRYYIKFGKKDCFDNVSSYPFVEKALVLNLEDITGAHIGLYGIDKLLKESVERVFLKGDALVMIALNELAAGGFRHLKELRIQDCDNNVVEYLANYSSTEREWVNVHYSSFGVFTKLETLQLHNMTHLKAIVSWCHDGKRGGGLFENLKEIRLNELPELTHLWKYGATIHPEAAGAIKLRSLNSVRISNCQSMNYLFTLSESASLGNLKTLAIIDCEKLEDVILKNSEASSSATTTRDGVEVEPSNNIVIKFSKLRSLKLWKLDSLTCFSSVIEFPQLKELILWSLEKHDCLASIFNHKQVMFPRLEKLEIGRMASKELWSSQYPPSFFPKLKFLVVVSFSNIVNIIPSDSAEHLSCLKSLTVGNCPLLEEVFESRLMNLGEAILFKNLIEIWVWGCGSLKNLLSSSVARNLPNLLSLKIDFCESMEEVIGKEEGVEDGRNKDETIFPQLKWLTLENLPHLKRFFPEDSNFKLPDGLRPDVEFCPELGYIVGQFSL